MVCPSPLWIPARPRIKSGPGRDDARRMARCVGRCRAGLRPHRPACAGHFPRSRGKKEGRDVAASLPHPLAGEVPGRAEGGATERPRFRRPPASFGRLWMRSRYPLRNAETKHHGPLLAQGSAERKDPGFSRTLIWALFPRATLPFCVTPGCDTRSGRPSHGLNAASCGDGRRWTLRWLRHRGRRRASGVARVWSVSGGQAHFENIC